VKSKLFNFLLDPLLDIILWLMREKDDHRTVQSDSRKLEENRLLGSGGWVCETERDQDGGQTTQIQHYRPLYRIDR
jgi:hypothetical protein